jgi:uncharacterized protein YbaR (Trm112 family)
VTLRRRITRLERTADGETKTLVCQECGEELRIRDGIELDLLAHEWAEEQRRRGRGHEIHGETHPDVFLINNHPCDWTALRYKYTGERLFPRPVAVR